MHILFRTPTRCYADVPSQTPSVASDMTRLEAISLLLAQVDKDDPEQYKALLRELVTALGYGDVLELFENLHEGGCYPLH